jgi:hypothetical protein
MWNSEKADADNKALITKLSAEFTDELKSLGVRLSTLEKNQSALKIDGFAQYRYEYTKNPRLIAEDQGSAAPSALGRATDKSASRTLFWLNLTNQFDNDTYFHGIVAGEGLGGKTADSTFEFREGNFNKRIGPNAELGAGRFMVNSGLGTLGGAPYMDGGKLSFNGAVKANLYSVKFGDSYFSSTFTIGDVKFDLTKNLNLSLAYFADKNKERYDSKAVGLTYKGIPSITLSGEYAQNSASLAKFGNNGTMSQQGQQILGSAPKAYYIKAKYKGAIPFVPGSTGLHIQYKKADPGFDIMGMASPFEWNAPFNYTTPASGGMAENIKGIEFGFETTVAMRTIFSMTYNKLDRVSSKSFTSLATNSDQSFFTAQLTYIF